MVAVPQNQTNCPRSIQFAADFLDENLKPGTTFILKDLAQGYFGTCPLSNWCPVLTAVLCLDPA